MDLYLGVAGAAVLAICAVKLFGKRHTRLPPGPKGIPFFGNIFDIPAKHEWLKYAEWCREYNSDMISLNFVGTPVVVVSSPEITMDLFEKRSSIYSDRAETIMLNQLVGWDFNFAFRRYGDLWREHRRDFHRFFNPTVVHTHRPRIVREVKFTLLRLLESPEHFMEHFRYFAGSLILSVAYGIKTQPTDDPYIASAEAALHSLALCGNAGAWLVDYFPLLRYVPEWFPGAYFKRQAAEWRKLTQRMADMPLNFVKKSLVDGMAEPSIAASLLEDLDDRDDRARRERVIRSVVGTAYVGGADTTVSTLCTFALAMVLFPDVQRKAQEELDRVVGRDRLPEYEDQPNLPYVTALQREVMRWKLVTPLAVPHVLSKDDEYRGYHFPAGTIFIGNAWAMHHDPKRFPNPETFDPAHYLNADGTLNQNIASPTESGALGFGRRICPGRHFSADSVWYSIAAILATYNLRKKKDEDGHEIEPRVEYSTGLLSHPLPFECVIEPRSKEAEALIRTNYLEAAL